VREEAARARAAKYGIPTVATSAAELLRHGVDVVHSCVANVAHAEVAEEVLAAGRHVVAEKPLALDEASARRLARSAREAGVFNAVCFTRRHLPAVLRLRDDVAAAPGGAHLVRGGYLQDWLLRRDQWDWRLDRALSGASATLADLGGHFLDLVEHVSGRRVVAVQASIGRLHDERDVGDPPVARAVDLEDHAVLLARLDGGALVSGTLSQVSAGYRDRLFLELSLGDRSLAWSYDDAGDVRIGRQARGFTTESVAPVTTGRTAFYSFLPDVYTAIRGGEPAAQPATFVDGLHSVQLIDAALRSAAEGRWIDVPAPLL
jgi:predicted dehydrogenase